MELCSEVDGDGFVALVCQDTYSGYVGEDWIFEQLLERFIEQMNIGVLFAAYPGSDLAGQPLRISDTPSPAIAWREVTAQLLVGESGLWLTDYTQLTVAAQFSDEPPFKSYHLKLPVSSGVYRVTLRQFAVSVLYEDGEEEELAAELVITPADASAQPSQFAAVPWIGNP
ncbi:TPA: hypothetical protein ACPZST_004067 [Yersinia enterocolitica]